MFDLLDVMDAIFIPLLLIAIYLVYQIANLTGNPKLLACFGTAFTIGVLRRSLNLFGILHQLPYITDGILVNIVFLLQLCGFYFIWNDVKKLVGNNNERTD